MTRQRRLTASTLAASFGLLALCFTISACGHSEAAAPPPTMELVTQTVDNYGHGHEGSVLAPPSPIPDETETAYMAKVKDAFLESDFAQLEKMAQQNRTEKGLLLGGGWKNNAFYDQVSDPMNSEHATEEDYQSQIVILKQWLAAYPASVTPRIALARVYVAYAFFARGDKSADNVSGSQWDLFNDRNVTAERYLLEAASLKDRDPHWYEAMQGVAFGIGWDKSEARDLLAQAVAFEPSYYHYYREYADYLKPQWYGRRGEITKYAEQASQPLLEPDASILYFRIASTLACNCEPQTADLPGLDWPKFKSGYAEATRLYGQSNINANRVAWVAYKLGDKATAQQAFAAITKVEMSVWWGRHTFDTAHDWATAP